MKWYFRKLIFQTNPAKCLRWNFMRSFLEFCFSFVKSWKINHFFFLSLIAQMEWIFINNIKPFKLISTYFSSHVHVVVLYLLYYMKRIDGELDRNVWNSTNNQNPVSETMNFNRFLGTVFQPHCIILKTILVWRRCTPKAWENSHKYYKWLNGKPEQFHLVPTFGRTMSKTEWMCKIHEWKPWKRNNKNRLLFYNYVVLEPE